MAVLLVSENYESCTVKKYTQGERDLNLLHRFLIAGSAPVTGRYSRRGQGCRTCVPASVKVSLSGHNKVHSKEERHIVCLILGAQGPGRSGTITGSVLSPRTGAR